MGENYRRSKLKKGIKLGFPLRVVVNTVQAVLGFLRFQGLADALVPESSATAK